MNHEADPEIPISLTGGQKVEGSNPFAPTMHKALRCIHLRRKALLFIDFRKVTYNDKVPADDAECYVLVDTERGAGMFFSTFEHPGARQRGLRVDRLESASRFKKPYLFLSLARCSICLRLFICEPALNPANIILPVIRSRKLGIVIPFMERTK